MPQLPARFYLLALIATAVLPVWVFAAYLLVQYAYREQDRFHREALEVARQVALVVEERLTSELALLQGLANSEEVRRGDIAALYGQARRLVGDSQRIVLLRDYAGKQIFDTSVAIGGQLPTAAALPEREQRKLRGGEPVVSDVYRSQSSREPRVAVALPVSGTADEPLILAITLPTTMFRDVLLAATPVDWTVAIGDSNGNYVTRSQGHDEFSGQPGLPEYLAKVVGQSGTFTARNFAGTTLLAGYFRSSFSDWFYAANIPLSVVEAPLRQSLRGIAALALVALLLSIAFAFLFGRALAASAQALAARAHALGQGEAVAPVDTLISEFASVENALTGAARSLTERSMELQTVLETVPVAVWFTYDPTARQVIRNRYAAELMGLDMAHFGQPDSVVDTLAFRDGAPVPREDRPLSRAMRGEATDNEESTYVLLDGSEKVLLSSARPILSQEKKVIGAVQISTDISDRKRGEEQRRLLVKELNHRVKNTMAVAQAVASQTLRNAANIEDATQQLTARLMALATAHDILTKENWSGAELRQLVTDTISPHADLSRVSLIGASVTVPANLAMSLSLAFFELTTNAIKYGALSIPPGRVSVTWSVAADLLQIEWVESGGPKVQPPEKRGFGTRMIKRILPSSPRSGVDVDFHATGVSYVFRILLDVP